MTATKDDGAVETVPSRLAVTAQLIIASMPRVKRATAFEWTPAIGSCAAWAMCNTEARLVMLLGQIAWETDCLRSIVEQVSPTTEGYGGGSLYRGRGLCHLTHLRNYREYGTRLGLDLIGHPELAAMPEHAARIFAAYWTDRGTNAMVDAGDDRGVTRAINGLATDEAPSWHLRRMGYRDLALAAIRADATAHSAVS